MAKPEYRVPSMREIEAIPWNGFNVISSFSGCGGSCLGYRMAGFHVLYANEFIPAAQETYKANHPDSILDCRDIRKVKPEEILQRLQMQVGELDLLDGSPPCASFSTAGKREAGWGKVKQYSGTKQRTDDLFFEYARLLRGLQPKVFVAENVSGLVKGTAKGYFLEILKTLKECDYNVSAKLLDAQWLGVPQMRQRLIFVGVRSDLHVKPAHPEPLKYRYSVREALPWIVSQGDNGGFGGGTHCPASEPSPTIGAETSTGNNRFPPSLVTAKGRRSLDDPCPAVLTHGREFTTSELTILVEEANGLNSQGQGEHQFLDVTDKAFPTVQAQRSERVAVLEEPFETVQASAGARTSSSWTHGTCVHPTEKRKLSIAELKRICAFPDDFILTGTYAQQWERLGRSVPPVMMCAIASTIRDQILCKLPK